MRSLSLQTSIEQRINGTEQLCSPPQKAGTADENMHIRLLAAVEREQVDLIRFLWVDHSGITRGKAVSRSALAARLASGVGLAKTRQSVGLSDLGQPLPGFDAVGEVRLMPDPGTYLTLPHAPGSGAMLCDLVTTDGQPWEACPRTFLRQALQAAADGGGYQVVAAFEPEFTLCSAPPRPGVLECTDDTLCFDNEGFDATSDFTLELMRALRSRGMNVQTCHPEFAAGQHEMTLSHVPALRAADQFVWQRAITRGLARRHGMWATFAPVPAPGMRGNGNHVHLSLWRRPDPYSVAKNLFADPADTLGLSELGRYFIGGLIEHLAALCALTCATVNSYERLRPGMWSGACIGYGLDNREAAIRIPSGLGANPEDSTNIEVKACDSTANPYLALGALIHAGLDGIRRRLDPGEPLAVDPSRLDETARRERGIRQLPGSLAEAVAALEADEFLMDALGPLRRMLYPTVKRADVVEMERIGTEASYHTHAIRF